MFRIRSAIGLLLVLSGLLSAAAQAQLVAAVLPVSRSAQVGSGVTVFTTIINSGEVAGVNCRIGLDSLIAATLDYQTTNPGTNAPTGTINTPVDIEPSQFQTFVLTLTPSDVIAPTDVRFSFVCDNLGAAPVTPGVNTLLLSAATTPVADVIALAATSPNTGTLVLDGNVGAFAVASINIGATETVTVSADTGAASLPVTLNVCETNPLTGVCVSNILSSISTTIATNATPTFSVFATASDEIAGDPASNRVFLRFRDASDVIRGATSVAIEGGERPGASVPPQVAAAIQTAINRLLDILLGDSSGDAVAPSAFEPVSVTVSCGTGSATFDGIADMDRRPFVMQGTVSFSNCDTINGDIALDVEGTVGSRLVLSMNLNGPVSAEGCPRIEFTDLQVETRATLNVIIIGPTIGSGRVSGTCAGTSFTCNLDSIDFDDEVAFARSCL